MRRAESVINYAGFFDVPESHSGILDRRITTSVVSIYGLGHLGSWIARALVALGVRDMTLHDFDTIEERNLSGSVYNREDIGKTKADAMVQILKRETLVSEEDVRRGIQALSNSMGYAINIRAIGFVYQPIADFYILATDNVESRMKIAKNIFEEWRMIGHAKCFSNVNPVLIDTRSNGASITVMNVPIKDVEMQKRYILDLEELGRGTGRINCDEANIIQAPMYVASIVSQMIASFARGKVEYYVYHGSLLDLGRYPYRVELKDFLPSL